MTDNENPTDPFSQALDPNEIERETGWAVGNQPEPARQADPRLHPDHRSTAVQLHDAQADLRATRTDLRKTQALHADYARQLQNSQRDADRHLRTSRHTTGLLERIANILGADPLDLDELPALVDGLRTTHDQVAIREADLRHHVNRIRQADIDRVKAHLGVRPGQAVGIALVPHDDHALVREPAYEAARAVIRQNPPRSISDYGQAAENARVWQAVEAALDAMGVPAGIDLTTTTTASCPYCLSTDPYRRNAIDEGDGPAWCDNDWHDTAGRTQELPNEVADRG